MRTLQSALRLTTQPNKAIGVTAIDQAILTCAAIAIIYNGLHTNPIADLELVRNTLADFFNHARELMPERQRDLLASDRMRARGTDRWAALTSWVSRASDKKGEPTTDLGIRASRCRKFRTMLA
jgi:hypothetical protein